MELLPAIGGLFFGAACIYFCFVRGIMAENKRLRIDNDLKLRMARWLARQLMKHARDGQPFRLCRRGKPIYPIKDSPTKTIVISEPTVRDVINAAEKAVVEDDWR